MRRYELLIISLVLTVLALVFCGCEEQQQVKSSPLERMTKPSDSWVENYGDDSESVLVYNLLYLDFDTARKREVIKQAIIDVNDPNSITNRLSAMDARMDELEAKMPNDPNLY